MTIREWWRRRRYCPECGAPWIVGEESERVGQSGDLRVVVRPHLFLVCPLNHERRLIDEYDVRCQEWILEDMLTTIVLDEPDLRGGLCRCPPGTTGAEKEILVLRRTVEHERGGVARHNVVEFSYPLVTCDRCDQVRSIAADFGPCWAPIAIP
jgi:hypothetical protein